MLNNLPYLLNLSPFPLSRACRLPPIVISEGWNQVTVGDSLGVGVKLGYIVRLATNNEVCKI